MSDQDPNQPAAGAPAPPGGARGFQIGVAVLLAVLCAGLYFGWRLTQFSPADIAAATHVQSEANAWRKLQGELKKPHTRADEVALYQGFVRDFPPASPPSAHEAAAIAALNALDAAPAPPARREPPL